MELKMKIFRGDIFLAQLDPAVGHEIKKTRPIVVVSNNANNEMSGTVTIVPLTSQNTDRVRHFEALILALDKPSKAKADQVRTLDKSRLYKKLGQINQYETNELKQALLVHLDLL
jgi:mRNA interferase MazF